MGLVNREVARWQPHIYDSKPTPNLVRSPIIFWDIESAILKPKLVNEMREVQKFGPLGSHLIRVAKNKRPLNFSAVVLGQGHVPDGHPSELPKNPGIYEELSAEEGNIGQIQMLGFPYYYIRIINVDLTDVRGGTRKDGGGGLTERASNQEFVALRLSLEAVFTEA